MTLLSPKVNTSLEPCHNSLSLKVAQVLMDSSTITFIVTLVIAFVFLRWFISSDDGEIDGVTNNLAPTQETEREAARERNTNRRPVNSDMIEIVQSIAPHLSVSQIRYDLQRTGSVQETVDRLLSEGTLPYPPGEQLRPVTNDGQDERNKEDNIKPQNLLKKYNVDVSGVSSTGASSTKKEWSNSAEERSKTLQEKKAEMILKARKRLEAQLKNEQDLSQLKN